MTYYDSIAQGYENLHKDEQLKKLQIIMTWIRPKKEETLLDVGCGTAFSLDYFDCNKTGIDPSKELLKFSRHRVVCASAESIPFSDESFDYVISLTAVHNFDDFKKGIMEMHRVGKKDFAFSILKKAKDFNAIEKVILDNFKLLKKIDEGTDMIYFLRK